MQNDLIAEARAKLSEIAARKTVLQEQNSKADEELQAIKKKLLRIEKATNIIKLVALQTQHQIKDGIDAMVDSALAAVFDDPYTFKAEFTERRGKTECDLFFSDNGENIDPLYGSGYGAVDIAAFALRLACWSLQGNQHNRCFVLDEPFKHLKGVFPNQRAIKMLSEVAKELGIQIITVSDERAPREDIESGADLLLNVIKKGKISQVSKI